MICHWVPAETGEYPGTPCDAAAHGKRGVTANPQGQAVTPLFAPILMVIPSDRRPTKQQQQDEYHENDRTHHQGAVVHDDAGSDEVSGRIAGSGGKPRYHEDTPTDETGHSVVTLPARLMH
jgi:hypothetical protein